MEKVTVNKALSLALRNFLNFLEDRDIEDINGYNLDKWRKKIVIPTARVQEIYISDEELLEAYNNAKEKHPDTLPILKMTIYSGARLKHVYEALKTFEPEKAVVVNGVARYPISGIAKGAKRGFWLYFPAKFLDELMNFEISQKYKTVQKKIVHGRVNAETIRKWHFNFMIIENDIPEAIADFIQGRRPVTVGSAHYLNKTKMADKEYAKIVDKFPI